MSVKIRLSAMFQNVVGGIKTAEVDGSTVKESLKELVEKYPPLKKLFFDEGGRLSGYLAVCVNGENVGGELDAVPVKPGDEIFPMLLIEGG